MIIGNVNCSFDNSVEKFLPESRHIVCSMCERNKEKIFLEKCSPQKCSYGHVEFRFDKTAKITLPLSFRLKLQKITKNVEDFQKKNEFPRNVPTNT